MVVSKCNAEMACMTLAHAAFAVQVIVSLLSRAYSRNIFIAAAYGISTGIKSGIEECNERDLIIKFAAWRRKPASTLTTKIRNDSLSHPYVPFRIYFSPFLYVVVILELSNLVHALISCAGASSRSL